MIICNRLRFKLICFTESYNNKHDLFHITEVYIINIFVLQSLMIINLASIIDYNRWLLHIIDDFFTES